MTLRRLAPHVGLLVRLYLVQLALAAFFVVVAWRSLAGVYATRPLFTRGMAGDDLSLLLALAPEMSLLGALAWVGLALVAAYGLASLFLGAGLLGALAGRGFVATARARWLAFLRLALWSLLPLAVAALAGGLGLHAVDLTLEDLTHGGRALGRALLGLSPGLVLLFITFAAVDQARAELVLGEPTAARALARGFKVVFTRPRAPLTFAAYLACAGLLATAYALAGRVAGAFALIGVRQLLLAGRFTARAATTAAQLELQLQVIEGSQIAKRPKAHGDLGGGEGAQPVERDPLDAE